MSEHKEHKNPSEHSPSSEHSHSSHESDPSKHSLVNGKPTMVGHTVNYTSHDGQTHQAVIDRLEGHHADVTVHTDQGPVKHLGVPHSPEHGIHSWDHIERS